MCSSDLLRKAPRQKRSADTVAVWLSNNLVMDLLKQIRRRMETAGMSRRQLLASSAIVLAHAALSKTALAQTKTEVSGEYYDWQKTMKPETPWLRDYSQIYQSGLFLCERDGDGAIKKVYLTFEQAPRRYSQDRQPHPWYPKDHLSRRMAIQRP